MEQRSRSIGMSRTKLVTSFPKVFGTSPYEYLRHMRLEQAEKLLSKGEMNITETAYWVGYSSSSHFTKAFREYYGMLLSRYLNG
jgi:AraC-like DNA-binding protein